MAVGDLLARDAAVIIATGRDFRVRRGEIEQVDVVAAVRGADYVVWGAGVVDCGTWSRDGFGCYRMGRLVMVA